MNVPPPLSRFLLLLNALSLDAPLAAIAWQDLAARHFGVHVLWTERLLLLLGTWLVYCGDRLLDTVFTDQNHALIGRHLFVRQKRGPLLVVWLILALVAGVLIEETVNGNDLRAGIALVFTLAAYFLICLRWPQFRFYLPRELVVSVYFLAAIVFFPAIHATGDWFGIIATPFCGVCLVLAFLNCLGISCWEAIEDGQAGEWTMATRNPWIVEKYRYLALFAAGVLGGMLLGGPLPAEFEAGAMLAALLLAALDVVPVSRELKPVLADLILIVPWLIVSAVSAAGLA
ncbi:hypothetical protein [Rubinisphaera margarita]|uniref:hypothetical protein n=1 Tax=Rubinisphaera margarita TaxID=2909586 RepID=UPI001EE8083C|nr:hypothetical protein [Rubinisphaera margarita]MCG6157377.1 hypothetical protein [Rubinisphaera margarita]